jgi:nucleoside-diphosphate-sugar epimerase
MTEPTVLITGSSGQLGQALMLNLPLLCYSPIGLDIRPTPAPPGTKVATGSITDRPSISKLLQEHKFKAVIHTATLHKPHIGSHPKIDFVDVNITGTLVLLEEAAKANCKAFVFCSRTTTFGRALTGTGKNGSAVLVDGNVVPVPKNIYGATKIASEDLCELIYREEGLSVIVLKFARFFPETDDAEERRSAFEDRNLKVNEMTYRRLDLADAVDGDVRWRKYVVSAPPPFLQPSDDQRDVSPGEDEPVEDEKSVIELVGIDARGALRSAVPEYEAIYEMLGWKFFEKMDRVYDSRKAVRELGWRPKFRFREVLRRLEAGEEWRSELAIKLGKRGYHDVPTGVYTEAGGRYGSSC